MPALLQVFAALRQLGRAERVDLLKCLNGLLVRENRASAVRVCAAQARAGAAAGQPGPAPARGRLPERAGRARRAAGAVLGARDAGQRGRGRRRGRPTRRAWPSCCRGIHPTFARLGHWPPRLDQALTRIDRLQPAAKSTARARRSCDDLPRRAHDRRRIRAPARDLRGPALPAAAALFAAGGLTSGSRAAARPRRDAASRSSIRRRQRDRDRMNSSRGSAVGLENHESECLVERLRRAAGEDDWPDFAAWQATRNAARHGILGVCPRRLLWNCGASRST